MIPETNKNKPAVRTKDLITFNSLDELRKWGDEIAKARFTPLKSGSAVMAAVLAGRELGFAPMFSANNIHPINGRATLGVHAITKLLLEAGVKIEVVKDYEACVDFVMKADDGKAYLTDENGKEVKRPEDGSTPKGSRPVIIKQDFADVEPKDHEVKGKNIKCFKTIIRLTRLQRLSDGRYEERSMVGQFSTTDAAIADLLGKDNWKKYPRAMCYARALSEVAHRLCGDLLGGLPETTEYADVSGLKYTYSEDHQVNVVDTEAEVIENEPTQESQKEEGTASGAPDNEDKEAQ